MVIEAQRVSYRRGGVHLVRNVTLAAGSGEFLALVGRQGSGARTLWRLLAGEIAPVAGRVIVRGGRTCGLGADPRAVAHGPTASRALLADEVAAPVVLCDEPASGPDGSVLLARCRAQADAGAAVIATIADLALAAAHAHTVAVFDAGRLLTWAAPALAVSVASR